MNKNTLYLLLIALAIFGGCKKDSSNDDDTDTSILTATIGGTTWTPDTVSATITYNTATNTKILAFMGVKDQKQINATVLDGHPADNSSFSAGNYSVDAEGDLTFVYSTQIKSSSGAYVFEPYASVKPGYGSLTVSSIDTVAKTITGTFSFTSSKTNYDANGNFVSIDLAGISGGAFTAMPYTFKRQ